MRSIFSLQSLSDEMMGSLTNKDLTFSDFQKLRSGVVKLRRYDEYGGDGLKVLEKELLSHHKVGFVKNSYSWASIFRVGKCCFVWCSGRRRRGFQ